MASEAVTKHTMNGGDGLHSYSKNSTVQGQMVGQIRGLVEEMVAKTLDVNVLSPRRRTFRVADMGCSVGPNTFLAVEMIIEAVEKKYRAKGLTDQLPEFHVFFNDRPTNDFNTLFRTLPSEKKKYYAAGVPGSFQGRLFPENFIDFVNCSYSLHWLSGVPKGMLDRDSPTFNKAKIHYGDAKKEVIDAFVTQFHMDMNQFLEARAREVVAGGMMALVITGRPQGTSHHHFIGNKSLNLLESCLLDMVKKGTVSEAKVDEFNIPLYFGTPGEIEAIVKWNGRFDIEKIDPMMVPTGSLTDPRTHDLVIASWRAILEGLLVAQFGQETTEEVFRSWRKKLEDLSILDAAKGILVVVLLKRNNID